MKFKFEKELDYIVGHLRYGHIEGTIEADSLEEAKKKLEEYEKKDLLCEFGKASNDSIIWKCVCDCGKLNKKSVHMAPADYDMIYLQDINIVGRCLFLINNKLKNCCNDCVYCEIVTETKRRAIPEDKTEVVLVNIKCSHMCVCSKYKKEVQDGR